jgi:imidazolonepropionase-like amidohydrolase
MAQQQSTSHTATVVIRAGTLIDGKSDTPRHNQVIVIQGNRIVSVSDAGEAGAPSGETIIDLSKATVLPGLIDSHTHIFLQGEDPAEGGYDANILKAAARISRRPGDGCSEDRARTRLYDLARR